MRILFQSGLDFEVSFVGSELLPRAAPLLVTGAFSMICLGCCAFKAQLSMGRTVPLYLNLVISTRYKIDMTFSRDYIVI